MHGVLFCFLVRSVGVEPICLCAEAQRALRCAISASALLAGRAFLFFYSLLRMRWAKASARSSIPGSFMRLPASLAVSSMSK